MNDSKMLLNLLSDKTILYVEDAISVQETMFKMLSQFCENVKIADNGKEALEIYKKHQVDIIISDIEMPVMSGIEFIENIREMDKTIPVIMLSAYTDTDYLISSIDLKVDAYIVKPMNFTKVKEALLKVAVNLKVNNYIKLSEKLFYDKRNGFLMVNENERKELKKKEQCLLNLLIEHKNNLVTYSMIENDVWNKYNEVMTSSALRTIVKKLRGKTDIKFIENISGLGYKIDINDF